MAYRNYYRKAIQKLGKNGCTYRVRFTSVPPEIDGYLQALMMHAAKPVRNRKGNKG